MSTITNTVTIGGTAYASPFTLSNGVTVAPMLAGAYGAYLARGGTVAPSLVNFGVIFGGADGGVGVTLTTGLVVNEGLIAGGAGSITTGVGATNGGYGIRVPGLFGGGGPGTIFNSGTVLGGAGAGGSFIGPLPSEGGGGAQLYNFYLQNTGVIRGGAGGANMASGGYGGDGGYGVYVQSYAAVTNFGLIAGGDGGAGDGAQAGSGGYGAKMGIYSTLVNDGTIVAGAAGAGTTPEGSGAGVYLRGGVLVNSGTIISAAATNFSGVHYAVRFGVIDAGTLVVQAGAKFEGAVFANGIQPDVLALGGVAPVTVSGIGTEYQYFNNISFANTGPGVIAGDSAGLAAGVVISGFGAADTIVLDGFAASGFTVGNGAELTLAGDGSFETLDIAGSLVQADFSVHAAGGNTTITSHALCFCKGTRIATPWGEVAVEALRVGDAVLTREAGVKRVKWIGRRDYAARFAAGNFLVAPVHIAAGALGLGAPARELRVSPAHGFFVGGALVPAWRLVDGVGVTQPAVCGDVEYLHVELEGHELLVAEGCFVESFFEAGLRGMFQNAGEFEGGVCEGRGLARVEDGFRLEGVRRRKVGGGRGRLIGWLEEAGPEVVRGWAQDFFAPEAPVVLDVRVGGARAARVVANFFRGDLRVAGTGSGCHGFKVRLADGVRGEVTVARAGDGAVLEQMEVRKVG